MAEHKELVQLLEREEEFLERIQQSRQINFDLLSEYKETLTAQYLLRGAMGLLGAFLVHLIIGASSRWNMLNAYATSYYKVALSPRSCSTRRTSSSARTPTPPRSRSSAWAWACGRASGSTRRWARWPPAGSRWPRRGA